MWWYVAGAALTGAAALLKNVADANDESNENQSKPKPKPKRNKKRSKISDFADAFDLFANGSDKL